MKMNKLEVAAMQELNSSYAIIVDGELSYQRQAMLNMFRKGAQWQAKQTQWIKVKDQLPDVGVSVFVRTMNKKYALTSMYIPTDCHGNVLGEKEWHGSGAFKGSITHWMPIPE